MAVRWVGSPAGARPERAVRVARYRRRFRDIVLYPARPASIAAKTIALASMRPSLAGAPQVPPLVSSGTDVGSASV